MRISQIREEIMKRMVKWCTSSATTIMIERALKRGIELRYIASRWNNVARKSM